MADVAVAATTTPSSGGNAAPQSNQTQASSNQKMGTAPAPSTETSASAAQQAMDEFEEIKLGSAKGRVPKELAKAIKEIEKGFHSKAQENAQVRKQNQMFQEFAQAAKEDPEIFFKQFGIDPDQYSQSRLAKKLEREMMDPHQRRALDLEEENKQNKEKLKQIEDQQKQQHEQVRYQQEHKQITDEMLKAWSNSGLPPGREFGQWMAATMASANAQGLSWTWEQAAAKVLDDFVNHSRTVFGKLNPQQLQEILGDEPLTKWREFDVKRVTDPTALQQVALTNQRPGAKPASGKKGKLPALSEAEWRTWRESGLPVRDWLASKRK